MTSTILLETPGNVSFLSQFLHPVLLTPSSFIAYLIYSLNMQPVSLQRASQVAQVLKNLPANAGDWGSIPGSERSLEEGVATHCNIPVCRIPWTEEPGGLLSVGSQRVGHDFARMHARLSMHACTAMQTLLTIIAREHVLS